MPLTSGAHQADFLPSPLMKVRGSPTGDAGCQTRVLVSHRGFSEGAAWAVPVAPALSKWLGPHWERAAHTIDVDNPWHKTQSFGRISTQTLEQEETGSKPHSQKPRTLAQQRPLSTQVDTLWKRARPHHSAQPFRPGATERPCLGHLHPLTHLSLLPSSVQRKAAGPISAHHAPCPDTLTTQRGTEHGKGEALLFVEGRALGAGRMAGGAGTYLMPPGWG